MLQEEKEGKGEKKTNTFKCQAVGVLNYLKICKFGYKQIDNDRIPFNPRVTE